MNDRFGTEVSKTSLNGSWKVSFYICSFEGIYLQYGPVAQLVRAPPCHGGGREFESLLGRLRCNAFQKCRSGGTGRRTGLKILRDLYSRTGSIPVCGIG